MEQASSLMSDTAGPEMGAGARLLSATVSAGSSARAERLQPLAMESTLFHDLAPELWLGAVDCPALSASATTDANVESLPVTSSMYLLVKRLLDVVLVLLVAPFAIPVLLICIISIKFTSKGPAFFRHSRVGQYGDSFGMWKLRTMHVNGDNIMKKYLERCPDARREWKSCRKLRSDPRNTAVGSLLRRSSLDELPQLWNVLVGQMSLVGPRPIVRAEMPRYRSDIFYYLIVKPGISGLWQVSGRSGLSYDRRVQLDVQYVRHWKLERDITILFKTVVTVLLARGAV
jgi:lipopolysaccharide/colanic/teichoic acid biosynthesis glycosyltransferase